MEKLIGAQILKVEEESIQVLKDGKVYILEILSDYGDCCGYANFTTTMLYSPDSIHNPVITNVKTQEGEDGESESVFVTFYGEYAPLVEIDAEAGSGSGWQYGASVTMVCKELGIDEHLVSW